MAAVNFSDRGIQDVQLLPVIVANDATAPIYVTTGTTSAVTLLYASGTFAASGNNTLVAANATKQIVVMSFTIQNESSTTVTINLRDGAAGNIYQRALLVGLGSTINIEIAPGSGFAGTINTALILNLSAAVSVGYTIVYYLL